MAVLQINRSHRFCSCRPSCGMKSTNTPLIRLLLSSLEPVDSDAGALWKMARRSSSHAVKVATKPPLIWRHTFTSTAKVPWAWGRLACWWEEKKARLLQSLTFSLTQEDHVKDLFWSPGPLGFVKSYFPALRGLFLPEGVEGGEPSETSLRLKAILGHSNVEIYVDH